MFFDTLKRLSGVAEKYCNREYSPGQFTQLIRRQFQPTDFAFSTVRDYAVDPNMIVVSGIYDYANDQLLLPHIEISLCYHPEQTTFNTQDLNWGQFTFDLAECICHEMIHREQYRKGIVMKKYISSSDEQEYLGDESEIDAYGFSIAAESVVFNRPIDQCCMYQVYRDTFDTDHSVVVKLEKEIFKYLERLELS